MNSLIYAILLGCGVSIVFLWVNVWNLIKEVSYLRKEIIKLMCK